MKDQSEIIDLVQNLLNHGSIVVVVYVDIFNSIKNKFATNMTSCAVTNSLSKIASKQHRKNQAYSGLFVEGFRAQV